MTRTGRFASWPSCEAPVSAATLAREMAAVAQVLLAPPPFPEEAARGSGQPVIVIPGFLSPDMTTARLREFLTRQEFLAHPWTCGLNIGPMPRVIAEVERQVRETANATGRPVSLVGISLGGTIAREVAKTCIGPIAQVITLVSPIHLPVATPLAPLAEAAFAFVEHGRAGCPARHRRAAAVPLTALFSRDDGVIDWRASVPDEGELVEVVEVSGPHMTISSNPQVQRIVADRLVRRWQRRRLNIHRRVKRIVLDEFPARLDHIAHQLGEKLARLVGMLHLYHQQRAGIFVQRGFPQLFGIHLAQALVALQGQALAAPFEDRVSAARTASGFRASRPCA